MFKKITNDELQAICNYYEAVADNQNKIEGEPFSYKSAVDFALGPQNIEYRKPFKVLLDPALNKKYKKYSNAQFVADIEEYVNKATPPNESQLKAILNALAYPVSIIQGPPGNGKTETILNLLSVILKKDPGKSVAVVSTNNEALFNIYERLQKISDTDENLKNVRDHFAVLGNNANISNWIGQTSNWEKQYSEIGDFAIGSNYIDKNGKEKTKYKLKKSPFLDNFPAFSSTVDSLKYIFLDENKNNNRFDLFDYVIIDECSQMDKMRGIIAASCARVHLVIFGDDRQLSPIINDDIKNLSKEYQGKIPDEFLEKEGESFLDFCKKRIPDVPTTFLNEHYRCHPSIIGFCNKNFYEDQLDIQTKDTNQDDNELRMRAVWYEGCYQEYVPTGLKLSRTNKRQIEIFVEEELPRLVEKLKNQKRKVAVIAPFNPAINDIKDRVKTELNITDNDKSSKESPLIKVNDSEIWLHTVHSAQGKEFDIVYLLTIEDYYGSDSPDSLESHHLWCQSARMVNVAVSRAKEEFCVITSSLWLPEDVQKNLTGYSLHLEDEDVEKAYYRQLMEYITNDEWHTDDYFGLHKSTFEDKSDIIMKDKSDIIKKINPI